MSILIFKKDKLKSLNEIKILKYLELVKHQNLIKIPDTKL